MNLKTKTLAKCFDPAEVSIKTLSNKCNLDNKMILADCTCTANNPNGITLADCTCTANNPNEKQ